MKRGSFSSPQAFSGYQVLLARISAHALPQPAAGAGKNIENSQRLGPSGQRIRGRPGMRCQDPNLPGQRIGGALECVCHDSQLAAMRSHARRGGGGGWGMNLRMNIQGLNVHGGSRRDGWGRGLRGAGERATFEKYFHFPTLYSISGI